MSHLLTENSPLPIGGGKGNGNAVGVPYFVGDIHLCDTLQRLVVGQECLIQVEGF